MPRVMWRGLGLVRRAQTRWADEARPRYAATVRDWSARDLATLPATRLLEGAKEIVQAAAAHYLTIQSGILPAAYMSEMFFNGFYHKIVKRKGDPPALDFLLGFDSAPIRAEKSLYDLAAWARSRAELAGYLTRAKSDDIVAATRSPTAPIADLDGWREFCRRFADHLDCFGDAVYDLDFAKGLAADDPAPLFEALKYFLSGTARSPHARQGAAAATREMATQNVVGRLKRLRLSWFTKLLRWRSAMRHCGKTRSPMSDWAGRSCAGCCVSSGGGWRRLAASPGERMCSG